MDGEKAKVKRETADELTAKDLALYLGCYCKVGLKNFDYQLSAIWQGNSSFNGQGMLLREDESLSLDVGVFTPILRPLSDMPYLQVDSDNWDRKSFDPSIVQYALDNYYDIFGWIDSGLAIDATTLNPNPYEE